MPHAARRSIYIFITIAIFSFAPSFGFSAVEQTPKVKAEVDRRKILVGDELKLSIRVSSPKDILIRYPAFPDNKIGGFEIKRSKANSYILAVYSVGKQTIPAIELKYKNKKDTDWKTVKTTPINITVESLLPKSGTPLDIKPVRGPLVFINPWLIAAIMALALAAIFGIWRLIAKVFRKMPPVKLPHETALEELELIRGYLAKTSDIKGYYVKISDCIRRYIERVFRIRAPEMTTEEFLNSMGDSLSLSVAHRTSLRQFLEACDLVKFAKYKPAKTEIDAVYLTAKKFVEETR